MTLSRYSIAFFTLLFLTIPALNATANPTASETNICPESLGQPVSDRIQFHRIAEGETLESIAQQYNLKPETLMGMNPSLQDGLAPVGIEIRVPPFDGIEVRVQPGQTWTQLAETYKVPADAIFDNNGCLMSPPEIVFIPGVIWSRTNPTGGSITVIPSRSTIGNGDPIPGYPLPITAEPILSYGYTRIDPNTGEPAFHSGVDYKAPVGTPVLTANDGVVVFAGDRGAYGNLIVINHPGGKQTRYAHLSFINVTVGQQVQQGVQIGSVGYSGNPDSNEPHLHFEVRAASNEGWVAENPEDFIRSQIIGE